MRAAQNFTYGDGKKSHEFSVGDEVPDKIAKDVPSHLILERLASSDLSSMTREQLAMIVQSQNNLEVELAEAMTADESGIREVLAELATKRDIIEWASEARPSLELDMSMSRAALEDAIVNEFAGQ